MRRAALRSTVNGAGTTIRLRDFADRYRWQGYEVEVTYLFETNVEGVRAAIQSTEATKPLPDETEAARVEKERRGFLRRTVFVDELDAVRRE